MHRQSSQDTSMAVVWTAIVLVLSALIPLVSSVTCLNGGSWRHGKCHCHDTYYGQFCQFSCNQGSPIFRKGWFWSNKNTFLRCDCFPGFEGISCDARIGATTKVPSAMEKSERSQKQSASSSGGVSIPWIIAIVAIPLLLLLLLVLLLFFCIRRQKKKPPTIGTVVYIPRSRSFFGSLSSRRSSVQSTPGEIVLEPPPAYQEPSTSRQPKQRLSEKEILRIVNMSRKVEK